MAMIVYASKTQNVARFVKKLKYNKKMAIVSGEERLEQPFILVTYTTGFGEIPKEVQKFLEHNHHWIVGVAASGNRNWGDNFAKAGQKIAMQYQTKLVHKFELAGLAQDVEIFEKGVDQIELFREK
ncbi:MAG: class Ib ribonucleoside-diphosphate reductase assembly flavoprotein NrdI [Culicoidibacterales bacterium]